MLHKLKGSGLPNVYLVGGVTVEDAGDDQTTAYANLDGLYKAIARAIAIRSGSMNCNELRFLRKRLEITQADVGALGGKTEQAAAKWEKGTLPIPKAEANLLRLLALSRFGTREDISRAAGQLMNGSSTPKHPYVVRFDGTGWKHDDAMAIDFASEQTRFVAENAPITAGNSSRHDVKYTSGMPADVHLVDYNSQINSTSKKWLERTA